MNWNCVASKGGQAGVKCVYVFDCICFVADCKSVYSGSIPLEASN